MGLKRFSIIALVLLIFVVFGCAGTNVYDLKTKFGEGKEYKYVQETLTTVETSMGQTPITVSINTKTSFSERLLSVDTKGNSKIEYIIGDFLIDMDMGILKIKLDTKSDESGKTGEIVKELKKLVGSRLLYTLDPNYKVLKIEGREAWDHAIASLMKGSGPGGKSGFSNMFGDQFLENLGSFAIFPTPDEPVKIGDSWSRSKSFKNSGFGDLNYDEKLTLTNIEKGMAYIDATGTFSGEVFGENGVGLSSPAGKFTVNTVGLNNTYVFDQKEGRLNSLDSRITLDMTSSGTLMGNMNMIVNVNQKTTLVK